MMFLALIKATSLPCFVVFLIFANRNPDERKLSGYQECDLNHTIIARECYVAFLNKPVMLAEAIWLRMIVNRT